MCAEALHLTGRTLQQVFAIKQDAAPGDATRRHANEARNGQRRHGLATTGFAHKAQHIAALHGQVDAGQHFRDAVKGVELEVQILNVQQRFAHAMLPARLATRTRIKHIAQAVAQQVPAEDQQPDGHAGEGRDPPFFREVMPSILNHRAPFGGGRLRADANEAQRGGGQHREAEVRGHFDDDG